MTDIKKEIGNLISMLKSILPFGIPVGFMLYTILYYLGYIKTSSFQYFIGIVLLVIVIGSIVSYVFIKYVNTYIKSIINLNFLYKYDLKILDILNGNNFNHDEGKAFKEIHTEILSLATNERKILNILNGDKSDPKEGQAFREIHTAILYLTNIEISCKIFHFDEMDSGVYIIHSNKDQAGGYVYSVPKDEMGIISQLHYLASKTVGNVCLECSSKYINDEEFKKIRCMNLISVGGPSKNSATKKLECGLNENEKVKLEYFINGKDQICLDGKAFCGRDKDWNENGKCYGLVTIAPNPFEASKFAIIIGGCGKEGQLAIWDYFNKHENLKSLLMKSEYSNKYIQFIIEAEYSGKADNPVVTNSRLFGDIKPIVKI